MPRFTIVTIAAIIALTLAACGGDDDEATPSPSSFLTPIPNVCLPNPDRATSEFQILEAPDSFSDVTSPVTVSGQVNAFEATYQVTIFDASGTPLAETFGTAQQPDMGVLGPFTSDLTFTVTESTPACIWVFEESARDGSPINIGQIPIVLVP